jgi:hypothetical protein
MSDDRKKPLWPWIVAVLIGLPVLYFLSSGPTRIVAFRHHNYYSSFYGEFGVVDADEWWTTGYAPLEWASGQPWGKPVIWYWGLFPIRQIFHTP